jgi:hypothetical protein
LRLAAYRIGGSEPAPLFTVIVAPSAESKKIGEQKKQLAERHVLRLKFWDQLLSRAKEKGVLIHAQRTPTKDGWISAGAGVRSGVSFTYVIWMNDDAAVELYIDTGDREENKRIFDALHSRKGEIEQAFGSPLSWERLDEKRAARVRSVLQEGGLVDDAKWPIIQDAMITAMDRLAKAVKPHLGRSPISPVGDLPVHSVVAGVGDQD